MKVYQFHHVKYNTRKMVLNCFFLSYPLLLDVVCSARTPETTQGRRREGDLLGRSGLSLLCRRSVPREKSVPLALLALVVFAGTVSVSPRLLYKV